MRPPSEAGILETQDALDLVAAVDAAQVEEGASEEPGPRQEHEGERQLRHDQRPLKRPLTCSGGGASRTPRGSGERKPRREGEEDRGGACEHETQGKHQTVDLDHPIALGVKRDA